MVSFASQLADALEYGWESVARPNQLPPPGDWSVWLLLAGRGFGKTRVLREMCNAWATTGQARRIAIVAATAADARDVIVEGESGILATAPNWCRPEFQSGRRRLIWPNSAIATLYSAEEPDRLRGPQHDAAVCDELGSWRNPGAWDMLMFGLRLGQHPRVIVATTPRPTMANQVLGSITIRVTMPPTSSTPTATASNLFSRAGSTPNPSRAKEHRTRYISN
jgi:phage terminase large subunit-like protein